MVQQQKAAGGKKLRRCVHRSPSEARRYAYSGPAKKKSWTRKGNFPVRRVIGPPWWMMAYELHYRGIF